MGLNVASQSVVSGGQGLRGSRKGFRGKKGSTRNPHVIGTFHASKILKYIVLPSHNVGFLGETGIVKDCDTTPRITGEDGAVPASDISARQLGS